jgi:endogenous inhibitor of DNA gyrase (YacG/DUF329 family)
MASTTVIKCKHCGNPRKVRTADVKRGWGLFCNKRCKALDQESTTGQYAKLVNKPAKKKVDDLSWMHIRTGNSMLALLNRKIDQMEGPQMEPRSEGDYAGPHHC